MGELWRKPNYLVDLGRLDRILFCRRLPPCNETLGQKDRAMEYATRRDIIMKTKKILTISAGTLALLAAGCSARPAAPDAAADARPKLEFENETAQKYAGTEWAGLREDAVIEISDKGLNPENLDMKVRQGILFFYNATKSSQIKFEIDFGKNKMACYSSATPNLAFTEDGKLASTRSVLPGNFASTCFPTIGTYAFRVFGVEGHKGPIQGKITVVPKI